MKIFFTFLMIFIAGGYSKTLKEVFDLSQPGGEFDRVVVLEKGKVYTGGLFLGWFFNPFTYNDEEINELNVKIEGHGAIIDLQGSILTLSYTGNRLDIDSCVIMNGTFRYSGCSAGEGLYIIPYGNIDHVTFYNPIDYGVRMEGSGFNSILTNNLVVNCITTGPAISQFNTLPSDFILTGTSYSSSMFEWYGYPLCTDNWSYNNRYPDEPLRHFSFL